jgi:hypothetical protein
MLGNARASEVLTAKKDTLESIMAFDQSVIHLGAIKKGTRPSFEFTYTNVGIEDLQIEFISLCDCTEAEYSTEPLAVGASDKIEVVFLNERKEDNEPVTLDIILANTKPGTDIPIVLTVSYTFEPFE